MVCQNSARPLNLPVTKLLVSLHTIHFKRIFKFWQETGHPENARDICARLSGVRCSNSEESKGKGSGAIPKVRI